MRVRPVPRTVVRVVILGVIGIAGIFAGLIGPPSRAAEDTAATPDALSASRTGQFTEQIVRAEYQFSLAGDGASWSAPNRAHDLRARVGAEGLDVVSRTRAGDEAAGGWHLVLRLDSLRRGDGPSAAGAGRPALVPGPAEREADRIVIHRGALSEWYANDSRGLEQGFTIASRPDAQPGNGTAADDRDGSSSHAGGRGSVSARELVLEMTMAGGLGAYASGDGQEILFRTGAGIPVLRYGSLSVLDAVGTHVDARFALLPGRVQIRIDDEDAVYPLTIDPLMTSPAWTADSNQANAHFASSVATAGDVNGDGFSDVIVGAPLFDNGQADEGRAFVFLGSASGLAISAAWTAESDQAGAQFGASVASAGDVNGDGFDDVIVGAPLYDNGQTDEGRAFVFLGSASGLATTAVWTAESNQANAHFGASVATAGDVNGDGRADIIVGAPLYDNGQTDEGRAFVYLGTATGPATSAAWTSESNQATADYGVSVASAGDVNGDGFGDVVVGADLYDNGQTDEGRAFVFLGSASGLAAAAAWTAESNQAGAHFGACVSTAGDVNGDGYADVIVGSPLFDNGQTDEGRAFVYPGSASGPSAAASWTAESDQASAGFGSSLGTAGDINGDGYADLIVGASQYDNGDRDEGRAFVYLGSASGPVLTADWTTESDQRDAFYATSVASAGDVNGDGFSDVIIGSPFYDNGQTDEGRAFVYLGSAALPALAAGWTADSNQSGALFGYSVASAGDVNGDGFGDVIVGAPSYDNGETNEGAVFVYLGSASGLAAAPAWSVESNQASSQFGYSVASAGDVNGDGYSDVIVGAYLYDNGQTDEGRAFVYLGSPSGLSTTAAWTAEGNQNGAQFGSSVASAGDVNGDGFADVIIGSFAYDNGQLDEGRAFVYMGSPTGLATTPAWITEGDQAGAAYGAPVSSAGDVNGDGYSDVLVGAWLYSNGETNEGRAYVYLGSLTGLSTTPAWIAESNQADALFGFPSSGVGDVNGDGYSDVVIGATAYDDGETDEGAAFLYLGSPSGLSATPAWIGESNQTSASYGYVRGSVGDVNGDGYSDVIIGDPYYDDPDQDEGAVFLYLGSSTGLSTTPAWTAEGNQVAAFFGSASTGAGDVNGDGFSDVIVGAYQYDNPLANEGQVFLFYGNSGPGVTRIPRQARADDASPIDVLGNTESLNSFRLKGTGRTPAGRARIRLTSEVKHLGLPLDGTALQKGPLTDSGAPAASGSSIAFNEVIAGLAPETVYRWRLRFESDSVFFPRSPWFSLPFNARTETDFRTQGCQDADADGYGVPGEPYCQGGPGTDCNDANRAIHPGATELCDAIDNDCDGTVDGFTTSCGVGACTRTGTCTAGSNNCAPGPPSAEVCDNIDNNCDGTIDNFPTTCGVGACVRSGTCIAGSNVCTPGAPTAEACDNIDNNCDGTVDNFTTSCGVGACARTGTCLAGNNSCTPGAPSAETCDNIDNNCDGTVDHFPTSCGVGGCVRSGTCVAGVDNCSPGPPTPEICDNIDNNCDGTIDRMTTTCGIGPCTRQGFCTAGSDSCTPGPPSPEACDNIDNNCDGTVDGFATSCGIGGCTRPGSCIAGVDNCTPGAPVPESCNLIDDDCDGSVDEGVQSTFYRDADGDTFGNAGSTTLACTPPAGYVVSSTDCNDSVPAIWATPGEARNLLLTHSPATGVTTLAWSAPASPGATVGALHYDTLRSVQPNPYGAASNCLETDGPDATSTDSTSPPPGSSFFYLIRARDWCPQGTGPLGFDSNGTEITAPPCSGTCTFGGSVSISPPSSQANMDQGPRTVIVTATGTSTFVSARLVITKSGGAVDFDSLLVATGTSWSFNWAPGHGVGTYIATATVSSSIGCSGTALNTWVIVVPPCSVCAAIVPADPNPTGGTGPRFYRQQNQVNNACSYPLGLTSIAIRARTICATCASPMRLTKLQYIQTGSFADETSNVVYTAAGSGDPVSTTQTATIDLSGAPLVVPASSATAKVRFIFSTSTPIWLGGNASLKSVLEGDFAFTAPSGFCSNATITGQKLEVTP